MRVAVLYDIHGNLPALEAVMNEIRQLQVEAIVVGGDVMPGPMPVECLKLIDQAGIVTRYIHGNGENVVIEARRGGSLEKVPEAFRAGIRWCATQLPDEYMTGIGNWPLTTSLTIDGVGDVLFCHSTPRSVTEIFTRLSPIDRIRTMFEGVDAKVVVCGHTHMQFDMMVDTRRIVNAGSVGMPFAPRGAYWLLLGPGVELRHTSYDAHTAATRIRLTSFPSAESFAKQVLDPPTEEAMLAAYATADGRG